jgi:hypothetical protein
MSKTFGLITGGLLLGATTWYVHFFHYRKFVYDDTTGQYRRTPHVRGRSETVTISGPYITPLTDGPKTLSELYTSFKNKENVVIKWEKLKT